MQMQIIPNNFLENNEEELVYSADIYYYKDVKKGYECVSCNENKLEEKVKEIGGDENTIKRYEGSVYQEPLEEEEIEEAKNIAIEDGEITEEELEELEEGKLIKWLVENGYLEIEYTRNIRTDETDAPTIVYDYFDKIYTNPDKEDEVYCKDKFS